MLVRPARSRKKGRFLSNLLYGEGKGRIGGKACFRNKGGQQHRRIFFAPHAFRSHAGDSRIADFEFRAVSSLWSNGAVFPLRRPV